MTIELARVADGIVEGWYSGIQGYYYGCAPRCLFWRPSNLLRSLPQPKRVGTAACDYSVPIGYRLPTAYSLQPTAYSLQEVVHASIRIHTL